MPPPPPGKKLIEVALPLDAINAAAAREKSIRRGHPSTLHLWWARRPLAAARAVIFAQLVDDPSSRPELFPTEEAQDRERQRLFGCLRWSYLTPTAEHEEAAKKARPRSGSRRFDLKARHASAFRAMEWRPSATCSPPGSSSR